MRHFNGYWLIYLGLALTALGVHSYAPNSAHVIVSLVAILILSIAALQATIVTLQHYLLKQRPLHTYPILKRLPPVETMQDLLFKSICAGFIFLNVSFVGAFVYMPNMLQNIHLIKIVLLSLAWVLFATLIYGYYGSGWRNSAVTYGTLTGLLLMTIALH